MIGNKQWWILMLALFSAACYAKTSEVSERSAALRRSLVIHDMYHDMSMSFSMSMEDGKSKGKKSKKSKSESTKGKGKGKGKGVSSKSGKGKGKGKGVTSESGEGTGKGKGSISESGKGVSKGKGKGKGSSSDSGKGASKGKGKGSSPESGKGASKGKGKGSSSESGKGASKGKGKGSSSESGKGASKGKGKGKGKKAPTPEVTPSPSMPVAPVAPVAPPEPSEPSAPSPSVPTATPPTPPTAGDIGIVLAPYDILYTIEQTRIPNQADYRGVTEVTQAYLDGFFAGVLDLSTDIMFSSSSTTNTERTFRLGQPVRVEYNTTIFLSSLSSVVPGEEELNALLMSAFRQQNAEYVEAVQGLSRVNIFSTTTNAEFVESTRSNDIDNGGSENSDGSSASSQPVGMISAAAAGAMILLATGYVVYRRSISEDEPASKFFDQDGHVTVAGETYTGETFTGASSMDSQCGAENMTHGYLQDSWYPHPEYMQDTADTIFEDIPVDDCSEGSCESYEYAKP